MEKYLRCFLYDALRKWVALLPWTEYLCNTACQPSDGMTQFRVLYGTDPHTLARYILGSSPSEFIESYLVDMD